MNNKSSHTLLVAALVAAGSIAQAKPATLDSADSFEGFSISLGGSQVTQSGRTFLEEAYQEITVEDNDTTTGGTGPGGTDLPDTYDVRNEDAAHGFYNKDAFNGQISLAYNLAVSRNWVLGLEVAKQFGAATRMESFAFNSTDSNYDVADYVEVKNNWSAALRAGYAVTNKFMIYGKVSYANAKITGNTSLQLADVEGLATTDLSVNKSVSGVGLGLGFEYNLDDNWFLQFEIERIEFNHYNRRQSSGTFNTTLVDGSLVTDAGVQAGEAYRGVADIGANLSKATISLGYRF